MYRLIFTFLLLCILIGCQPKKIKNPVTDANLVSFVNPFIGTDGPGNTYPGATLPFGMVQLSPDIGIPGWDRIAGYYYPDTIISGFSHLHLTGTGAGDLYDLLIMPTNSRSNRRIKENSFKPFSTYSHAQEKAEPGYYSVDLLDYGIKAELSATERTGIHRYTFPKDSLSQVHIDLGYALNWDRPTDTYLEIVDNQTLRGYRHSTGWARNQKLFFEIKLSKPYDSYELYEGDQLVKGQAKGTQTRVSLNYGFDSETQLIIRTGLSTADLDGATASLKSEAPHEDFETYRTEASRVWENQLNKIQIETDDSEKKHIFYTMMYQSMLAPTLLSDLNGKYKAANDTVGLASGFDRYDTFSLWDTYRAAHPLYTLLHAERVQDFIRSILAHYEETGLLPVWSLQGNESNMMIGYHAVPVIVDAYFKGIGGFDAEKAYEACVTSATDQSRQIDQYMEKGFIPVDEHHENWSVSKTLEYAYDDWCIAQFAKALGKDEDYKNFLARSENWRNVYDSSSTFMRPRNAAGEFIKPFVAKDYSPYFCESNAWHYFWAVPQNIEGLIETLTAQKFESKLDSMFSYDPEPDDELPIFSTGMIGQYAHGNEPSHHVAYLYNYLDRPWKTQKMVRKILETQYRNEPDGHCGNEDCGQMSSWYIFSSLGFYPVNPAQGTYSIGTPLFKRALISLENGKEFEIVCENYSENHPYIQSMSLNGQELNRSYLTHREITEGGQLIFRMGKQPAEGLKLKSGSSSHLYN